MWDFITTVKDLVNKLAQRVIKGQNNLEKIIQLINQWNFLPLFDRIGGQKETLLDLETTSDRVVKR